MLKWSTPTFVHISWNCALKTQGSCKCHYALGLVVVVHVQEHPDLLNVSLAMPVESKYKKNTKIRIRELIH